ncbi:MAG: hypothetical protein DRJ07_00395 [Bacteroidetes bacterium]|nr:MAG: hypothetical protein DRJ07_00395 [Bacteroidota bacterium]
MKHRIIQIMLYLLISITLSAKNKLQENEKIVFQNEDVTFYLSEQPFKIIVRSLDDKIIFSSSETPSFEIDEKWIAVEKVVSINNPSKDRVEAVLGLTNGTSAKLEINQSSPAFFHIEISTDEKNVTAVKGVNTLNPVEEIYGFGETWNGSVAQRGKSIDIWDVGGTPDECAYIPYYVSTQNYAFWLEYGGLVKFDVGKSNATEIRWESSDSKIIFNLFIGSSVAESIQGFIKNTAGTLVKPPRWAYKPWAWLMHDPDKPGADISTLKGNHLIDMVNKLKEMDIPVGVTWTEPPWQTERTSFIPNKEFDSDLKGTIRKLNEMGVKTLAWTVPYTLEKSPNWQEAYDNNYLVGMPANKRKNGEIKITHSGETRGRNYNYIDFTNPDAVKWWQSEIEKALDLGFVGFKLDDGQGLQKDAILYDNKPGADLHNSYAYYYNKAFYDVLKKRLGDDFLMIPRAAFTGSGSVTNFKWPGDLSVDFGKNGLSSSVFSTISASLSGLPFLSTDIGGFDWLPASEEVWLRWAQFGAMIPGMQTLNMPWWYSEKAQQHYRYLSWLHTDMIPYWQSLGNMAVETGTPICRHLIWDYQDDVETWRIDDEFTVGENILVAPIIEHNYSRKVYLPEGKWYDFWDDSNSYEGKKWIKYNKGWLDNNFKFPLYIREGAIIPLAVQNEVSGFGWKESADYITMAIWPKHDGESSFTLYDLENPIQFKVSNNNKNIVIKWGNSKKDYLLRIHTDENSSPLKILCGSKEKQLTLFTTLDDFLNSKKDGAVYLEKKNKIIIRKNSTENSGLVKILLKE